MAARIVVTGHGCWGKNIARNLHALGSLYGVCETSSTSMETVREQFPEVMRYDAFDSVLSDPEVDAVAISTPAETHARLSLRALKAGRDVFVEKPLALALAEGQEVVDTAERLGRILMVGHLLEYHPAVEKLHSLIREGVLGKLQYVYSNRLNLGKVRREENILWSFAPHDISVMLTLIGESPIEVMATGGTYVQPNVADVTVTNLLFDNGVRGHIFVSWLHPYKEQRLVVVGSKKMAVFDDRAERDGKLLLYDQCIEWIDNAPVARKSDGVPVQIETLEPLRTEMIHFIDCVTKREQPRTGGRNGLRVLHVLQAAQQSLQMGGNRVPLQQPVGSLSVL